MNEGLRNIGKYIVDGELPPLAWCPFTDIAWFNLHLWGSMQIVIAYILFPICLFRIYKFAPNPSLWTPPVWALCATALFVPLCGIGHLLRLWAMFSGSYNFEAAWMLLTGMSSMIAMVGLWLHGSDLKNRGRSSLKTL